MGTKRPVRHPQRRAIGDRVREQRRRRFVGRRAELSAFRTALAAAEPPFSVAFVYGPGGIGKTSLLDRMAEISAELGIATTRLDLKAIQPQPETVLRELGAAMGLSDGEDILDELGPGPRRVILFDTYESAAPLDGWFRNQFVPALGDGSMVVFAGRHAPDREWRVEPGWAPLVHAVPLGNLLPEDVQRYLSIAQVPEPLHAKVIDLTHGHPLAGGRPAEALRDLLQEAAEALAADPRDRKLARAIDRTFVHPAETQELAAEVLDLPFSTYKRHLKAGVDRVTDLLWQRESWMSRK